MLISSVNFGAKMQHECNAQSNRQTDGQTDDNIVSRRFDMQNCKLKCNVEGKKDDGAYKFVKHKMH